MKTLMSFLLVAVAYLMPAQRFQTDNWMGDLNAEIHDKTIGSLVVPGAYRCGLHRITQSTGSPERCNTVSQSEDVQGLLDRGARYLDLSVVCWRNEWYLGAFSYSLRDGLQIAVGQPLGQALDEMAEFLSEKGHSKEVVILHLSRYVDSRLTLEKKEKLEAKKDAFAETSFGLLDSLKKDELLKLCSRKLSAFLYQSADPLHARVDSILASVQKVGKQKTGAAIFLVNDTGKSAAYPGITVTAQCRAKDKNTVNTCFRRTDSLLVLNRQWNAWRVGEDGCYQVRRWVLSWRSNDSKCTSRLAEMANESLEKLLEDETTQPLSGVCCVAFLDRSLSRKIIRLNTGKTRMP